MDTLTGRLASECVQCPGGSVLVDCTDYDPCGVNSPCLNGGLCSPKGSVRMIPMGFFFFFTMKVK